MSRVHEAFRRASGGSFAVQHLRSADFGVRDSGTSALCEFDGEFQSQPSGPRTVVAPPRRVLVAAPAPSDSPETIPCPTALAGKIVASPEMSAVSVEQYRRLAATLTSMQMTRSLRTLMVTSALPNEGKTLTAANLALTLAQGYGRRVLLIDADFRRPAIHRMFGLTNVTGLSDSLRADAELPSIAVSERLDVIVAGRPAANPMEALSSDRLHAAVSEAPASYDWVLIDTPPVGVLPDAQVLTRAVDGVLFVVAAASTPYTIVQRSIEELGADRIVGMIMNRADISPLESHAHYYGHYYTADRG